MSLWCKGGWLRRTATRGRTKKKWHPTSRADYGALSPKKGTHQKEFKGPKESWMGNLLHDPSEKKKVFVKGGVRD